MRNPEKFKQKIETDQEENLEEKNTEELEKEREEKGEIAETMKVPEIVVQPEKGRQLLSIILKGHNPDWGNSDSELAKSTKKYFSEHPLNTDIKNTIDGLTKEGVDEESLYNLALTYQHPERTEDALSFFEKYKDTDRKRAEKLQQKLIRAMETLDKNPSFRGLDNKFTKEIKKDIAIRQERLEESRQRIERLVNFFQPKKETSDIRKVNLVPTDFLYKKQSGQGFSFGKEQIVYSPIDDYYTDGQDHEFLHGVINPIVDKLDNNLSEDHKRKIAELTSGKIKQHYGEECYGSHLSEGFIRTYVNFFEKGEKPVTYKKLQEAISQRITNDHQFKELLIDNKELKERFEVLGISNLKEFIEKSEDYFKMYEENKLDNIIYDFLGDYEQECKNKPEITFEDFVLQKFVHYLNKKSTQEELEKAREKTGEAFQEKPEENKKNH